MGKPVIPAGFNDPDKERIAELEAENAFLRTQWQEGGYGMFTKVDKERLTEENQRLREAIVAFLSTDPYYSCGAEALANLERALEGGDES
jgi:hypothetical protein